MRKARTGDQWLTSLETSAFHKIGDKPVNDIESSHVRDVLIAIGRDMIETAPGAIASDNRLWCGSAALLQFAVQRIGHRSARGTAEQPTFR